MPELCRAAYNFLAMVKPRRYALVAYVNNSVGQFVEQLRRDLHPSLPHMAAHLTVLPPRRLAGTEEEARENLERICSKVEPFEVSLDEVETFIPVTPTVFLRVGCEAHQLRELHDRLNCRVLATHEEWPYMPHVTIAKLGAEQDAQEAYLEARRRWARFQGSRCIPVRELTFVREESQNHWVDLAGVPLGGSLVSPTMR
jgi:2'-5' RNA ligase